LPYDLGWIHKPHFYIEEDRNQYGDIFLNV
jgi:hypothetical protein